MPSHGLFLNQAPPCKDLIRRWIEDQNIVVNDAAEIAEMENDEGWRLITNRDVEVGEVLCRVPKTAILTVRTSSLPPLPENETGGIATNHTILHLALALLHEFRLAGESPFWGYLQSLPREAVLVPLIWEVEEICGEDGRKGLEWLRGTEAERDMQHREAEGLAIKDLQSFYASTSSILPPTQTHPLPSPFSAFLHAYSLISTRAFIIDLYHLIALTPFCDILNHSSTPHTSLQSDDFVCHKCGSLRTCTHDIPSTTGINRRIQHLGEADRRRLEVEADTVDMIVESWVEEGQEVFNSYGEGLGDARLLVEWGFLGGDFVGRGLVWEMEELSGDEKVREVWEEIMGNGRLASPNMDTEESKEDEDDDGLFASSTTGNMDLMALDNDGKITIGLYTFLYIASSKESEDPDDLQVEHLSTKCEESIRLIERLWSGMTQGSQIPSPLETNTYLATKAVVGLMEKRMNRLHRSDLDQDELFRLRDALSPIDKLQQMGMTLSINERILLETARDKWSQLLDHAV